MGNFLAGGIVAQPYTLEHVVLNIVLIFALSMLISWFYKRTHKGLSYSQTFVITLVLMSVVVTIIMMVIGNSLARAFALLGAFTIIRFRTAVKETRDIGFIFFALAMGMAVGTDNYLIGVVGTLLVLAIIWFLDKINFGAMHNHEFLLAFTVRHEARDQTPFEDTFKKYFKQSMLLNINAKEDGKVSEMTYNVSFKDTTQISEMIRELSGIAGVERVNVVSSRSDTEY